MATETGVIGAIIQRAWLQKLEIFIYYQGGSFVEAMLFLVGCAICDVFILLDSSAVWAQPENKRNVLAEVKCAAPNQAMDEY